MAQSAEDRLQVERELAQDILSTHRKRKREGMSGGTLAVVTSCSWDNIVWPCRKGQWAEERLAEQAAMVSARTANTGDHR